jgi:transcriptional regulator with GAF, ATPase, and Fis domain
MINSPSDSDEFEYNLTEIAITFIKLRTKNIDTQIENALRSLVMEVGFDRATFVQLIGEKQIPLATHCWAREGYSIRTGYSFAEQFPFIYEQMEKTNTPQFFSSIDALPLNTVKDRTMLQKWGPRAMFCIPLNAEGKTFGWITTGTFSIRKLSQDVLDRLVLAGNIFMGATTWISENHCNIFKYRHGISNEHHHEIQDRHNSVELVGESRGLLNLMDKVAQVASSDSTVLILGETGTGKELIAQKIHSLSARRERTMLSVNCAGLPQHLIEDDLFGHEKGAFTGAMELRKGRFEVAHGSSLFLDEVGELPITAQAKLLRVLQERQFERLGSTKSIYTDVRILAATNRDLPKEILQGKFREDLFYRLNVFPLYVPPLRERLEDIPLLVEAFVQEFMTKMGKKIKRIKGSDINALQKYDWPGNVRELRNVVERALILSKGPLLSIPLPSSPQPQKFAPLTLVELERNHILETLKSTNWRVSGAKGAAKLLGINPKTLESRMRRLGIVRPPKQPPDEYFNKARMEPVLTLKERW